MRSLVRLWLNLSVLSAMGGACLAQGASAPKNVEAESVEVSLVPDKSSVMLGEPVYVSFNVKNKSERNLQIMVGGDYRNRLGRPESFAVEVVGEDGGKVPQPDAGSGWGGIAGAQELPASGSYTFRLFLPHWASFEKPGTYTITARRLLQLGEASKGGDFMEGATEIPGKASVRIQVVPLDAAKMGELIEILGKHALGKAAGPDSEESMTALKAIHDERTIPYFLEALSTNDYSRKFHALDALAAYHNDQALDGLMAGMKTGGQDIARATTRAVADQLADNIRHSAGVALSRSPHPRALGLLLDQRKDSYYGVRLTVAHALGSNKVKAEEAISILEEMTKDPNEMVSGEAKRYLERLKAER